MGVLCESKSMLDPFTPWIVFDVIIFLIFTFNACWCIYRIDEETEKQNIIKVTSTNYIKMHSN